MWSISLVPHDLLGVEWDKISEILERAIKRSDGRYTSISVLDQALKGEITVWVVLDDDVITSVFTVRLVDYPERRVLFAELLAGSGFKEWAPIMLSKMIEWGKLHNCTHLEAGGRDGWQRYAEEYGFKKAYTILERKL